MAGGTDNLKPFTGADDPRRQNGRGRPSKLNEEGFIDAFALALTSGEDTEDIAGLFDISERTVRNYKKDPRVKAASIKLTEDRILRVTRRIDSEIERRLSTDAIKDLSPDELVRLRKEYLPGFIRQQVDAQADASTIDEVMTEAENDPEFAERLRELVTEKD